MSKSIGQEFMEKTQYKHLAVSDQNQRSVVCDPDVS